MELLKKGADPISIFEDDSGDAHHGRSVLYHATSRGCIRVVEALLDKGVDINLRRGIEDTALSVAAEHGHKAIVQLLLNKGADVNVKGIFRGTALTAACSGGHKRIARLLLDNGADVNAQGKYTLNALISASQKGHEETVKLLLEAGAIVDASFEDIIRRKGNALTIASGNDHDAIVEILLKSGAQINANPLEDGSALAKAASGHHSNTVKLLLGNGADPNMRDSLGSGASDFFFQSRPPAHEKSIPLRLIQNGADLGDQLQKYNFILIFEEMEYHGLIRMLLNRRANKDANAKVN